MGGPSERPTWYQLLRETQGDPAAILRAGVIADGSRYVGVEWRYLVDFDAQTLVGEDAYDENNKGELAVLCATHRRGVRGGA